MRSSPSLHSVVALLDHRRRRYHRVRRLWGTGLGLLGGGLLFLGGWVTLPASLRSSPPAGALPSVVVSAPPAEGPEGHGNSGASQGASPLLLAGARQPHACQTLPPWQVVCAPGEGFDAVFPALLWHATAPAWTPWALPQPGQGSVALPTLRMHAGTTPPGLPARGNRPPPRLSASACGTLPCPAAPAVRLPPPVPARRPAGRRPPALRAARPRKPAKPVPSQQHVYAYGPPVLAESERLVISPAAPERLAISPEAR